MDAKIFAAALFSAIVVSYSAIAVLEWWDARKG